MTAHGLLGHGRANQYGAIIKDYNVLLNKLVWVDSTHKKVYQFKVTTQCLQTPPIP